MNEVLGTARNIILVLDENGNWQQSIEGIFIVAKPVFDYGTGDSQNKLVKMYEADTVRFSATPTGMRKLANVLIGWADEADATRPSKAV